MFEHLLKIFDGEARRQARVRDDVLAAAIEQTLDGTDSRLRGVSGYKRRLKDAVACAVVYAGELVEQLPAPVDVRPGALTGDSLLRAFFSSGDHINEVFSLSRTFREFLRFADNRALPECYALVAMEKREKTSLGYELDGDMVKRDVLQTTVNFSNYRIITPDALEGGTRRKLKERAFNNLVAAALARIVALRSRRDDLVRQKSLLQEKLRALKTTPKFGLEGELDAGLGAGETLPPALRKLQQIESELRGMAANPLTLEDYLGEIIEVMSHPADYLVLREIRLRLDRMGVKIDSALGRDGAEYRFCEVAVTDGIRRVVALVRIPHRQMEEIARRISALGAR